MISGPDGTALVAIHEDRLLVPASILKLLTGLAVIETMGAGYRFPTDFFSTENGDLKIKGYGDPMQISEELELIAQGLAERIDTVNDLLLDDSYFSRPISIPGRGVSPEPYDAPNGALCVNFNTVAFVRRNGKWVSDEKQTPLLPMVVDKIRASGLSNGRITLAGDTREGLRYAGELYRYFLIRAGIHITGKVARGVVDPLNDRLIWRYESGFHLDRIIEHLLTYSNNFIANQLLLSMGAHVSGPPATLDKGLEVLRVYCDTQLQIKNVQLVEASGISRLNRITARSMIQVLDRFYPYRHLMLREGNQLYKTGTLHNISTRAGYITAQDGSDFRFVVILNTPGKNTAQVMRIIEKALE